MKEGKIYISGAITGVLNAFELFEEAENELKEYYLEVVNPMKLPHNHNKTWASYMREDIKALCDCDSIYMLENWSVSIGAGIERNLAIQLGIKQIYQRSE